MGRVYGVNVVVGIPSFGMVSTYFYQAAASQQFPLVSSKVDKIVLNRPIADARNEIVEFALAQNANYIFWLDDDVIAPSDAFLKLFRHQKDIVNGVYWSKSNPSMPLLFRNHLEGPYYDWKIGDFIEIDAAGNGLTLVKTDVYRKISETVGGPWYSTEYHSFAGVDPRMGSPANNTEDLYFYWKARQAGFKIWADTSVQAFHYDKVNDVMYGIPPYAPQAVPAWELKARTGKKLIADIGSGPQSPYFDDEGVTISFDIRQNVKPDVVCDVRRLPVPNETFDIVHSSHTLEHFRYTEFAQVLEEWVRVLKVGGELRLHIPNLRYAAQRILDDEMILQDYWVIYGEQDYPENTHMGGFTPKGLRALIESLGVFEDIIIKEGDITGPPDGSSWFLMAKATKARTKLVANITPEDIVPGPPGGAVYPIRIYDTPNPRPMTEEEIEQDKDRNPDRSDLETLKQSIIDQANGKPPTFVEDKERDNGLESNNETGAGVKRRSRRKAGTSG